MLECPLQEQLGPAVAAAFPEAAQFVLSAEQLLASSITPDLAASLHSVLVYGADLHALDVLSSIIHAGVKAGRRDGDEQPRLQCIPCARQCQALKAFTFLSVTQAKRSHELSCVVLTPDAITWVCPGIGQEAAGLPLLRALANQVRRNVGCGELNPHTSGIAH